MNETSLIKAYKSLMPIDFSRNMVLYSQDVHRKLIGILGINERRAEDLFCDIVSLGQHNFAFPFENDAFASP